MIVDNYAKLFKLPEDSLWAPYLSQIVHRMYLSEDPSTMPTTVFAQKTVYALLDKRGPPTYMSIGGHALLIRILQWLPRGFVLWFLWSKYGESSQ